MSELGYNDVGVRSSFYNLIIVLNFIFLFVWLVVCFFMEGVWKKGQSIKCVSSSSLLLMSSFVVVVVVVVVVVCLISILVCGRPHLFTKN